MLLTVEPREVPATDGSEVVAYLLGLGSYAFREGYQYAEEYHRLHQVIRALAQAPAVDRELEILRYGAQIKQVDSVLAALFVEGARERLAAGGSAWVHISEETYFRVAVDHCRLMDYVSMDGHFALPAKRDRYDAAKRYRLFIEHFLSLPECPTRQGLRLALLSLFDRSEENVKAGLALCDRLRGCDQTLAAMAAARLSLAIERREISRYAGAYRFLGVQIVATVARWGLVQALPHLQRMLDHTAPLDREARVLRAHLEQTIEQLVHR